MNWVVSIVLIDGPFARTGKLMGSLAITRWATGRGAWPDGPDMPDFVTSHSRFTGGCGTCFVPPPFSATLRRGGWEQHHRSSAWHFREDYGVIDSWLPFLIFGAFALLIPTTMIVASFVFSTKPTHKTRARTVPFESGVSEGPPKQQRFTVSFYLTAMLFILFDIEIVFLYPLAVILEQLGWFGFVEFGFFIGILGLAYVYIWRKGALEWR
jgi:NADH-quinone oxidoreductase subunit A